jgi:hypothetical protein
MIVVASASSPLTMMWRCIFSSVALKPERHRTVDGFRADHQGIMSSGEQLAA